MILYGAGGHAKSVYDCILSEGKTLHGIFDDNPSVKSFMGFKVISLYSAKKYVNSKLVICIGSNRTRYELAKSINHEFGKAIHQTAYLAERCVISNGAMILAKSIIQTEATIGYHTIINTGAIVEHDCLIGDYVSIGPGAVICGNVKIGQGTLIGANVTILPGIKVGKWAIVGAGSVVLKDVGAHSKVAGNPIRSID